MGSGLQMIWLGILCFIGGASWVALKISLEGLPPLTGLSSSFAIASVSMLCYIKIKRIPIDITIREFKILMGISLFMYMINFGLIYWAQQYLSAGITAILTSSFPLFASIISHFVFKSEPFNMYTYSGVAAGIVGIVVIFYDQLVISGFNLIMSIAASAVLVAVFCNAASVVIIKKYLEKMDHVLIVFYQTWMSSIFLVALTFIIKSSTPVQWSMRGFLSILFIGAFNYSIGFLVYFKLLKQMNVTTLSFITYIIPLVALVCNYIVYGEVLSIRSLIGMSIIFSGLWLSRVYGRKINFMRMKAK
jgi:drug/metabolite transporter (DMT)-like permease